MSTTGDHDRSGPAPVGDAVRTQYFDVRGEVYWTEWRLLGPAHVGAADAVKVIQVPGARVEVICDHQNDAASVLLALRQATDSVLATIEARRGAA
jgi:hypothetical protein